MELPITAEAQIPYYRLVLSHTLTHRQRKNSHYSMRAYARDLKLDSGNLSAVLSGRKSLSLGYGAAVASKLKLAPAEAELFLHSLAEEHKLNDLQRVGSSPAKLLKFLAPVQLENELYDAMSTWYSPAILDLTLVEGFQSEPQWIASALGIELEEAVSALDRLERVGLLKRVNGRLVKSDPHVTTRDKTSTSRALRNLQLEVLQKTIEALNATRVEDRSINSMTMAIDPEKLPLAKRMIECFMDQLCRTLESGSKKQVFELGVNLFPIQRDEALEARVKK